MGCYYQRGEGSDTKFENAGRLIYWGGALETLKTEVTSKSVDPELAPRLLADLEASSLKVNPAGVLAFTRDPADNKFLECAIAANAPFLVTGNTRHFPQRCRGVQVITPRVFFTLLVEQLPD